MNTVTPYPTLTAFPTPAGTPMVNLAPIMDRMAAGQLGPQAVQWWQTSIAPFWGAVSAGLLVILILSLFFIFYQRFTAENMGD